MNFSDFLDRLLCSNPRWVRTVGRLYRCDCEIPHNEGFTNRITSDYSRRVGCHGGWSVSRALLSLTKLLNYDCKISNSDKKLICKSYKNEKRLCCFNCLTSIGHHKSLPADRKVLTEIASYFNAETGFWDSSIGCMLPRQYRSPICVSYNCNNGYFTTKLEALIHYCVDSYSVNGNIDCINRLMCFYRGLIGRNAIVNSEKGLEKFILDALNSIIEQKDDRLKCDFHIKCSNNEEMFRVNNIHLYTKI